MIRILHVLTAMDRAGTETMLMNLYRTIDRSEIQFDFAVSATRHCDFDDEIISMGGRIIHYPLYKGTNHFAYKKWWKDFFSSHPEYHIVHGHIGSTASIYLKIAKSYGCYTIAHSHNASEGAGIHGLLYRMYSYPTRNIADYFIGCSNAALTARYGSRVASDAGISTVLKNGIDVGKYAYSSSVRSSVLSELGISSSAFVIGTVGRLTDQKNPLFILDILKELNRRGEDFLFLWAGTGEMKYEIETSISSSGLSSKVRLLGVRSDIDRLLSAMNVFLLPSKYEGLPVIGVEVQASGLPMLCSDRVSSEVKITEYCRFLDIDSASLWADAVLEYREFVRNPSASSEVTRAGYDIRSTAAWLSDFYKSVPPGGSR